MLFIFMFLTKYINICERIKPLDYLKHKSNVTDVILNIIMFCVSHFTKYLFYSFSLNELFRKCIFDVFYYIN